MAMINVFWEHNQKKCSEIMLDPNLKTQYSSLPGFILGFDYLSLCSYFTSPFCIHYDFNWMSMKQVWVLTNLDKIDSKS